MNAKQRIMAAARRLPTDCVPAAPYIGNYGAAVAGVPISQYNTNGKTMAEAQAKAWEILQTDVVVAQSDNYYIAEAFGVKIHQPYNDTPYTVKNAIDNLQAVETLGEINPYQEGRMYVFLEAVARLKEIFGNEVAIRCGGTGMFSLAGHLLGTQNLLMEIALSEIDEDIQTQQLLHLLLEKMTHAAIAFSTAVLEAGADFVVCGDSSASPDLISPAIYDTYVFPYEKKFFAAMQPLCQKHQAVSLLHICGNTTPILKKMAQTGADILEIDHKVDLRHARELVADTVCLMGNLDPSSVLLSGSPKLVAEKAQQAIDAAGVHGGFILGSGCEVATKTPIANIKAMCAVARSYRY